MRRGWRLVSASLFLLRDDRRLLKAVSTVLYLRNLSENVTSEFIEDRSMRFIILTVPIEFPHSGGLPRLGHDPPFWSQSTSLPLLLFRLRHRPI